MLLAFGKRNQLTSSSGIWVHVPAVRQHTENSSCGTRLADTSLGRKSSGLEAARLLKSLSAMVHQQTVSCTVLYCPVLQRATIVVHEEKILVKTEIVKAIITPDKAVLIKGR